MTVPDSFLRAVGMALRMRREEREMSQEALAHASGLDRGYVSHIELGKRNIGLVTLRRLTTGLGVPLSDVIIEAERIHVELPDDESP